MIKASKMIRLKRLSIDEVFEAMDAGSNIVIDDVTYSLKSQRLVLFKSDLPAQGLQCVRCNIVGSYFILETTSPDIKAHLNLYAVNDKGVEILMTKDHILPKSRGGKNVQENYQTMCQPCNGSKGNQVEQTKSELVSTC